MVLTNINNRESQEDLKRILVVDDDVATANYWTKALQSDFRSVDTAYSVSEALDLLESDDYDLLITDLHIGHDSGMILAKHARKHDPCIEVIIITGFGSFETAREAIDLGVISYLTKPVDIYELKQLAERATHTREFNIRTSRILHSADDVTLSHQDHMRDLVSLYHFVQKLSHTVEAVDTIQVLLRELMTSLKGNLALLGVNHFGIQELYAFYDGVEELSEKDITRLLKEQWNESQMRKFEFEEKQLYNGTLPLTILNKRGFSLEKADDMSLLSKEALLTSTLIPLSLFGESIGFIVVWGEDIDIMDRVKEFFHTLTSLIAPAVYRCLLEKKSRNQAQTDGLTGIANRQMFQETLLRDIQRTVRHRRIVSAIIMDIDNFKKINDNYGHLTGDEVLKDLTSCVKEVIRGSDFFARYGGEEFVVILSDTDLEGATLLAERIRFAIDERVYSDKQLKIDYSTSIGVSCFDARDIDIAAINADEPYWIRIMDTLIDQADKALYRAKRSGKNCVIVDEEIILA